MKQQKLVVDRVRVEHRLFALVESASLRKLDPTQYPLSSKFIFSARFQ